MSPSWIIVYVGWLFISVVDVVVHGNTLTDEIVDPAEALLKETTPVPPHEYDGWEDWESWEVPAKIFQLAPMYKLGHDYDGLPVYLMEFGKWNLRELGHVSEDELGNYDKYLEWNIRRMSKDASENINQGVVQLADFDGFAMRNFASSTALKLALKGFTSVVRLHELIKYGFHINTNFAAETFLNIARPFMGNVLEKVEIYGTRSELWKPVLLSRIPADQLPTHYGGLKDLRAQPLAFKDVG